MANIINSIINSFFGAGDIFSLLLLAVKIVALIFIIGFVRNRFGNSWFATGVTFALAYIILFQAWSIFGPIIILYLLVIFGITGLLMDLTITKPWAADAMGGASRRAMMGKMGR